MNKELTPGNIMQLGLGFWGSKTLLSAIELGLFTKIAETGPLDCEALSQHLEIHSRSARDFFDALVALGMLNRDPGALLEHGGNGFISRPGKTILRGRDAGDGQSQAV